MDDQSYEGETFQEFDSLSGYDEGEETRDLQESCESSTTKKLADVTGLEIMRNDFGRLIRISLIKCFTNTENNF